MSHERPRSTHPAEDLSVLSRRGALSEADQQAFAHALESSATLAAAHQLGLDFDQIASVKPGDDALIARVAGRAVSRPPRLAGGRLGRQVLLLAAGLALAGSAAAWWQRSRAAAPTTPTPPAASAPASSSAGLRSALAATDARVTPSATARAERTTPPANRETPAAAPDLHRNPQADPAAAASGNGFDSAEALFREANAARRRGDAAIARALYLRLEHDFPASDEAHLAHVSLGNLLLAMGRPREAEAQFAGYAGGRSTLAQEALVGRAQSLAALGRGAEERRVWQALLRDYPGSVYAARAQQRLDALGQAQPGAD